MYRFGTASVTELHGWLTTHANKPMVSLEALSHPEHEVMATKLTEQLGVEVLNAEIDGFIESNQRFLEELASELKTVSSEFGTIPYLYPESHFNYAQLNDRLDSFKASLQATGMDLSRMVETTTNGLMEASSALTGVISQFEILVTGAHESMRAENSWSFDFHEPKPESYVTTVDTGYEFFPTMTARRLQWIVNCTQPESNGFARSKDLTDAPVLGYDSNEWFDLLVKINGDEERREIEDLVLFNIESVVLMQGHLKQLKDSLENREVRDAFTFFGFKQALMYCMGYYVRSQSTLNKVLKEYILTLTAINSEAEGISDE